jgi:hypothetical protein
MTGGLKLGAAGITKIAPMVDWASFKLFRKN